MQQRSFFTENGQAQVVAISFEPPEALRELAREFPSVTFLSDPERALYRLYSVEAARWWGQLIAPRTLWHYAKAILRGRSPFGLSRANADVRQLGGNFVIGIDGRVKFARRSQEPADRPAAELLERVIRSLPPPPGDNS